MALGRQIVYLIRLSVLHNADEVSRISHIAIMKKEAHPALMWILIEMVYPPGIKGGRPPFYAMNNVSFLEQKL
jgi:hypothetical protein